MGYGDYWGLYNQTDEAKESSYCLRIYLRNKQITVTHHDYSSGSDSDDDCRTYYCGHHYSNDPIHLEQRTTIV